jgi:opacity protein-like surface antigen
MSNAEPHAQADLAPRAEASILAGLTNRYAQSNLDGIAYEPALQLSFQARGYVWSWLNAAVYHRRASHGIDLPRGAAGFDYERIEIDKALAYSLGARIEPTYRVSDVFRAWVSVGLGWGRMSLDRVHVQEATRSYTVRERAGVFVEVPMGIGASYELVPRWLTVQMEADIAPLSKQSGTLFGPTPYVDSNGSLHFTGSFPTQSLSTSFLLGVSFLL